MPASNEKELRDMIAPQMQEAVESLIDEIIEKNIDIIERVVYDYNYSSGNYEDYDYGGEYGGEYQRTGEFKEAWSMKTDGHSTWGYKEIAGADFTYDPDKIYTFDRPNNSPPRHQSIDNKPVNEYLADLIYQGHGGIWNMPKRNAFESLEKWLTKSQFRLLFQDGMTRAGIQWKKSAGGIIRRKL